MALKLRGSTLVETLIAMVIIMCVFLIGSMIYLNVISGNNLKKKLEVQALLKELMVKTKDTQEFFDDELIINQYKIQKSCKQYEDIPNVEQINLSAFDNKGNLIDRRNELFLINEKEENN